MFIFRLLTVILMAGLFAMPANFASTVWQDIGTYNQRICENQHDAESYHGRSEAYFYLKEYDKALADATTAKRLYNKDRNNEGIKAMRKQVSEIRKRR